MKQQPATIDQQPAGRSATDEVAWQRRLDELCHAPFGVRRHERAAEVRSPVAATDRRGRDCGRSATYGVRTVRCNLPAGHGGVCAVRKFVDGRVEAGGDPALDVYETVLTWGKDGVAASYMGRRP